MAAPTLIFFDWMYVVQPYAYDNMTRKNHDVLVAQDYLVKTIGLLHIMVISDSSSSTFFVALQITVTLLKLIYLNLYLQKGFHSHSMELGVFLTLLICQEKLHNILVSYAYIPICS